MADQKAAQNAIQVSEKVTPELVPIQKKIKEMELLNDAPGGAYTGNFTREGNPVKTEAFKEEVKKLNSPLKNVTKKVDESVEDVHQEDPQKQTDTRQDQERQENEK